MNFSEDLVRFARAGWRRTLARLARSPGTVAAMEQALSAAGEEEGTLFQYLAATLPPTDWGDYPPELLMGHVRHALKVREEFSWCAALPEHIFLKDVLAPRVNTEALSPCRPVFYRQLAPRVRGLSPEEAISQVNVWCAQQVAYRSTDDRTASALAVYRCGYGRCGEESTFGVNALRSVGLAARQVYAPRWSHCDDNHAWVEAYDGKAWRFLGACEPEPRLDMGWFTRAAGRAMLTHTRVFVGEGDGSFLFPGVSPLDLDVREGVAYESTTARYARVRPFTVRVEDRGAPAAGAKVGLYILNDGGLRPIAQRVAEADGVVRLNLGLGSLWVTAERDGLLAEALTHTGETDRLTLTLAAPTAPAAAGRDFTFAAPPDSGAQPPALTAQEKRQRRETLERAKACRAARGALGVREANALSADRELSPSDRARVLATLTEKDRDGEIDPSVLADCAGAFAFEDGLPAGVFEAALLCPRVGLEPLAPWRRLLTEALAGGGPEKIWAWLTERITLSGSYGDLPQTPGGAWRLQMANEGGLRGLFCALCRAKGIPARLGGHGEPEVWRDGAFRLPGKESATLCIGPGEAGGQMGLMRWAGGWQGVAGAAPGAVLTLPPGRYRLITAARLPNGNQLARRWDFSLSPGGQARVEPSFRRGSDRELLQRLALPDFQLTHGGEAQGGQRLLAQRPVSLLCWVEPGAEPTEHLYHELDAGLAVLTENGCAVHLIAEGREPPVPAGATAWAGSGEEAGQLARRLYLEPGQLPLVVLADRRGDARFACAGYNVGLVELLGRLSQSLTAG